MGAPVPEMNPGNSADEHSAEVFVGSLRTISPPERRKHASVYNYWLSIRRERQFPPIRDLDPLEISDAGPFSLLLEMIGGGEDAEIRHIGHAIKDGATPEKVGEAPHSSLLSCVAKRLPVVAACRDAFAFEDEFEGPEGKRRCWVTLLPFSATGTWIDYVYGFVSLDGEQGAESSEGEEASAETSFEEAVAEVTEQPADESVELEDVGGIVPFETGEGQSETETEPAEAAAEVALGPLDLEEVADGGEELEQEEPAAPARSSISQRFLETLGNVGGFYGRPVEIELDMETASLESWDDEAAPPEAEPDPSDDPSPSDALEPQEDVAPQEAPEELVADEPHSPPQSNPTPEGTLQTKLTDVRAKADEARQAKLRANAALYQGLSAAYDFALDAEDSPEEYLKLVQAEGLKIQLRSPMRPVAKLAFDGLCDETMIEQLEAILAWAFDEELPRGTLAERIEAAGGIGPILSGMARAA
jgi:hypothetical protein